MNQVNCPVCGEKCVKSGKTKAGSQRWLCKSCKSSLTHKINNETKELQMFLEWLFGKESQYVDTFKSIVYQQIGHDMASNPRSSIGMAQQIYKQMEKYVK